MNANIHFIPGLELARRFGIDLHPLAARVRSGKPARVARLWRVLAVQNSTAASSQGGGMIE